MWRRFHLTTRWWLRLPLKAAVLALGVGLVLFPRVDLAPRWIMRLLDMNSLIDSRHERLAPLEASVREELPAHASAADALPIVEAVVHARIPYAWDWDTWGVMDYWPTVDEVMRLGREDCDGRAVVAASLLRRLGYEASLATDFLHVWVVTPAGSTMNPTSTSGSMVSTSQGTKVKITRETGTGMARALAYGVAKFPLVRAALITALLCLVVMHPWSSFWRRVAGCLMFWIALLLLRQAGGAAAVDGLWADVAQCWAGFALAALGWLMLAIRGSGPPLRSSAAPIG